MKAKAYLLTALFLFATGFLAGQASEAAHPKQAGSKKALTMGTLSGEWQILKVQGETLPESEKLFSLNLDCLKKSVAGYTGCNYLNGKFGFKARKNQLEFRELSSTRMACPLAETESRIIEMLGKACTYEFSQDSNHGQKLELKDRNGNTLLTLNKMKPLDGRWDVSRIHDEKIEENQNIYLIFNSSKKTLYGKTGCNNYSAPIEYDARKPSVLHIGQGISTMMACPEMEIEQKMLKALQEICSYKKFSERKAILCDTAGNIVLELTR